MSTIDSIDQVTYPESDGRPMGETDVHRKWMVRIDQLLTQRLRGRRAYIGSNLLVYYQPGQPARYVVPDNFVVLDCEPVERRTFRIWEENRTPDVVFEVTSRSTSRDDLVFKPPIYERLGVQEYFLYDPTAEYPQPALQGFRLENGGLLQIESATGELDCLTLGISLRLAGKDLEMCDTESGQTLLTEAESERAGRELAEARNCELEAELRRMRGEEV